MTVRGLSDEGFEDGEDAALLAAGESSDGSEESLCLTARLRLLTGSPA